jgi:L-lactate dehydrogenase
LKISQVAASSIDAYVLGEHGNNQFVAWSTASIGGIPIEDALPENSFDKHDLEEKCKFEGRFIMEAKGAIAYGIGAVVASICQSIIFDTKEVRTVSVHQPNLGCCISWPMVLGKKGIEKKISLPLTTAEKTKLENSARAVKDAAEQFEELRPMFP